MNQLTMPMLRMPAAGRSEPVRDHTADRFTKWLQELQVPCFSHCLSTLGQLL